MWVLILTLFLGNEQIGKDAIAMESKTKCEETGKLSLSLWEAKKKNDPFLMGEITYKCVKSK